MLNTYIIDDDLPSIKVIEFFLADYNNVHVAGRFTNPLEALDQFEKDMPQLIFLDINMLEANGMDVAKRIIALSPETDIIFTTAYDNFAVDAFTIDAVDYMVKPIMKTRFDKSMERILKKFQPTASDNKLKINCFGKFKVYRPNEEPVKWRTEKSKELAALLMARNGQQISRDEIIELLWPETDLDKAVRYLHNSIYYIRKSFETYAIDRSSIKISGNYSFVVSINVDSDLAQYNSLNDLAEKDLHTLENLTTILYRDFLEGEDWSWAVCQRELYAKKYSELSLQLSKLYVKSKELNKAEELLRQAYGKNPYDELITIMLIKLYVVTGQKIKAAKHFGEYSHLIKKELGISPGKYLKEMMASSLK